MLLSSRFEICLEMYYLINNNTEVLFTLRRIVVVQHKNITPAPSTVAIVAYSRKASAH